MKTETLPANDPFALPHALDVLRNGGLVAFPTDTVYGLGALAFDSAGINRLYVAKGRNHAKAIAILLSSAEQIPKVAQKVEQTVLRLAQHFWPGPLTLIVPRHPAVPDAISPLSTVGIRVPDHPVALKLLAMAGPMAVTSANISGQTNADTAGEVLAQMRGRIHLILDGGRTPGRVPSTVVDCTTPALAVLRTGPISMGQLQKVLGAIRPHSHQPFISSS